MFVVTLAGGTPNYVTGYQCVSLPYYNKNYVGNSNMMYVDTTKWSTAQLQLFFRYPTYWYYDQTQGKLIPDTTKFPK